MLKVLFVCMGNICRSPLAEGIMRHLIKQKNLENSICVASAGTHSKGWHEGDIIDSATIAIAKNHGIDISSYTSAQLKQTDLEYYDLILVSDSKVYRDVHMLATKTYQRQKIKYLLSFNEQKVFHNLEDPYYTGQYQKVFDEILAAVKGLLQLHVG